MISTRVDWGTCYPNFNFATKKSNFFLIFLCVLCWFALLINADQQGLNSGVPCDARAANQLHPKAKSLDNHEEGDIFSDEAKEAKAYASRIGKQQLQNTLEYLKGINSNTSSLRRSIDPTESQCKWMTVKHVERAGLGHTLAYWLFYLHEAIRAGLTYHASFFSPHHDICDLNATATFFGLHGVFYWAHDLPPNGNPQAKYINIGDPQKGSGCNTKSIEAMLKQPEYASWTCSQGQLIFVCHNAGDDSQFVQSIRSPELHTIAKAAFIPSFASQKSAYRDPAVQLARESGHIIIGVHIRRGDVTQSRRVDKEHRLASAGVYMDMLRTLVSYHTSRHQNKPPISIFFLCEGSPDASHVLEFDQIDPHRLFSYNVVENLAGVCNPQTNCSAQVLPHASFLTSFTLLCESHVLVASTSGFSWSAAALCEPPITIAIRLSQDYEGINNHIDVVTTNGNKLWNPNTKVQLPGYERLWDKMLNESLHR